MLDNNHNNSHCDFTAELVSYLYGEGDAQKKVEFETHLNTCSNCVDELAGFSFVRSSVLHLREEFSTMETPSFVFPTQRRKESGAIVPVENINGSWLNELRKIFSLSPAWLTTAMAALVICIGLTLIVLNFSQNDEMAITNKNDSQSTDSPTIDKKTERIEENAHEKNTVENLPNKLAKLRNLNAANMPRELSPTQPKQSNLNDSVLKVSNVSPGKTNGNKSFKNGSRDTVRKNKKAINKNKIMPSLQAQKIPKLVEMDDEEDDSLRLADLFDEVAQNNFEVRDKK
ncbi:MAG: hypothetical protein ABR566_06130 [Pyrinomonadaceae bacterium]